MIVPIITVADAAAPTEADLIKRNKVDETLFAAIAAEFGIYPIYESVFRVDSCTGEIWLSASYSGGRYHLYRHRRRHVAQHAHHPEPGRRHRTGNFGFYRQIRRLHKKLL